MLATKWDVLDSKVESALKATTQICVTLDIFSFSRRYIMGLLPLSLFWPTLECFTDTFFAGLNSLMGNTWAQ